ncbi:hypothetical protein ACFLWG_00755 [Chloroflexota bacterium]
MRICLAENRLEVTTEEAGIPFRIVAPTYNDDGTPIGDPACHYIVYKKLEYVPKDNPMPPEYRKLS